MGDIKSAQIALDPELSSQLGDAGRRDLLYQVKQDASPIHQSAGRAH